MTERRRFEVVPPDWGETHLTPEAVVAYVDGELAAGPHERASRHIGRCPGCAAEIVEQRQASSALRGAAGPSLPSSLMSSLCAIPSSTELPAPPAGLSVGPGGELGSVLRPERGERSHRWSRRVRFGAGAAMSGLAIGALAFGAPASGAGQGTGGPFPSGGQAATPAARFATAPVPREQQAQQAQPARQAPQGQTAQPARQAPQAQQAQPAQQAQQARPAQQAQPGNAAPQQRSAPAPSPVHQTRMLNASLPTDGP